MFSNLIREVVQAEAVTYFTKTAQQSPRWLILGSDTQFCFSPPFLQNLYILYCSFCFKTNI